MNKRFYDYLFNYWVKNFESLCRYCEHDVPCSVSCPKYTVDEDAVIQLPDGQTLQRRISCMEYDFGTCDMLRGTPCETCAENNCGNFTWNGVVPVEEN